MNALRVHWPSRTCLPYSEEAAPKRGGQGVSSPSPSMKSPWIERVRKGSPSQCRALQGVNVPSSKIAADRRWRQEPNQALWLAEITSHSPVFLQTECP